MTLARIARAYEVAARAHVDQTRKGRMRIAYLNHPVEVALMVAEAGASEDAVVAAVLHDVVEDSDTTLDQLEASFGPEVAALVAALTDDPTWDDLSSVERKRLQAARMPDAPPEARLIKIADQTSNLHDLAREPDAWAPGEAEDYAAASSEVVDACRGVSADLEARFDAALEALRAALDAAGRTRREPREAPDR